MFVSIQLCAYLQAPQCVRLLVRPPYIWDPDQPDRTNQTPMYFAESRDDLVTLYEMIHLTREQRQPSVWPVRRPQLNGFASVCLFWPQQMLACPIPLRAVSLLGGIGLISDCAIPLPLMGSLFVCARARYSWFFHCQCPLNKRKSIRQASVKFAQIRGS